ncbi:MAG: NAD-dependent epimerase/dehydratase family protein [Methanosarcinales archaeon]
MEGEVERRIIIIFEDEQGCGKMRVLITGGAGFVGSHAAEYYANKECEVIVFDNLSRVNLLKGFNEEIAYYNWNYLRKFDNVELVKGDIREKKEIENACKEVDAIIHAAAQVAVTTSLVDPKTDFDINCLGTFNVLEAARKSKNDPAFLYCSTNKVYGDNVNKIPVKELEKRYIFSDKNFNEGIPEDFPIDLAEHTPYGCSKLAADLYVQDYGKTYGLKTCVFRMSCIYGDRQFGTEDQGWVAHFAISTLLKKPLTIYGDGKQVRDILFIDDLIDAFDAFIEKKRFNGSVYNIGGGKDNTISLLELLDLLEEQTGLRSDLNFENWREGDQKVYISDITRIKKELNWEPKIDVEKGLKRLIDWVLKNKNYLLKT